MFYLFLFNQNIQQSFAGTYFKKVSAACGASIEKTGNYCNLASAKSPKYYSTGQLLTVDDCITKCKEDMKCTFFIFGTGSKAGRCWGQYTASSDCPEGWIADSEYDFWKVLPGEANIVTTKECSDAAQVLSLTSTTARTEVETSGNFPKGCYNYDPSGSDKLWINAATSGTSLCSTQNVCVCKTLTCKDSSTGDVFPKMCHLKSPSNCHGKWKVFVKMSGSANPFNGVDVIKSAALAPIVVNGKTDMYVGDYNGNTRYYKNTGTNSAPVYEEQTGSNNPMDGNNLGSKIFNGQYY